MRSIRFQVILITSLLVILGNGFLAVFIVQQSVESLMTEKYEKLETLANYMSNLYTVVINVNLEGWIQVNYDANKDKNKEPYETFRKTMRDIYLEAPLKEYSGILIHSSEELGAGFYFSDLNRILAFQLNPEYIGYKRLVYMKPIIPMGEEESDGSFIWVEESYHNIQLWVEALRRRAMEVTLLVILATLMLAGIFVWSFSTRLKRVLKTLTLLKKDLHSPVPTLSGEFGYITSGIGQLADTVIQTRSRSELILRSAKTGMIAFDPGMNIVMINDAARIYLGSNSSANEKEEVLDRLGHLVSTTIQQVFETGNSYSFDGMRKVLDNKEKYFNIAILPNVDMENEAMVLVTLDDVTENVKLIKEAEKNESLKMLGLFTTGVAHEIRNPLTSIKGFIQILHRKVENQGENTRLLHLVLREIERLENLIKDLITYARPSKPNFEWVPIAPLLETIIQVLTPRIAQKKIHIETVNLHELELFIDRRQVYQVFFNLILNAIQAVQPEGQITLRAVMQEHFVDIEVQDNGRGIEKSDFGKIFTPFYTTKDKGTGLGLAISRRMIEDHEGKIYFDSVYGEGTTFRVRLYKYRTRKSLDMAQSQHP